MNSKDINFNLYGVYIIKKYLFIQENDKLANKFLSQINTEYMLLFVSLLNKNNKKLSCEILYIFIFISYPDKGEELFCLDEKILLGISTFLGNNKNDSNLLKYGIWLIMNIIGNNKISEIFLNYRIIDFFEEIYERNLLDSDFMTKLMICLKKLIIYKSNLYTKNKNTDILCLIPAIKIIKTQLRPNLPSKILYFYVNQLYTLSFFISFDIFYKMTEFKIHKEFMELYPLIIQKMFDINNRLKEIDSNINNNNNTNINEVKKQLESDLQNYINIELIILKIFGKMMSLEDGIITQILIDNGISKFLNFVLQSDEPKIIKNAAFCISNICCGAYGQLANLYEKNTFIELIKVSKNIYEALIYNSKYKDENYKILIDTFREINFAFANAIINSISEKRIPLASYDNCIVILFLVKGLDILKDNNIDDIIICDLEALYRLIIDERDEMKDNGENNNNCLSFVEFMEKNGLREYLEKLSITNKNNEISVIIKRILENL